MHLRHRQDVKWELPSLALCAVALSGMLTVALAVPTSQLPHFSVGKTKLGMAFQSGLPFPSIRVGVWEKGRGTGRATKSAQGSAASAFFASKGESTLRGLILSGSTKSALSMTGGATSKVGSRRNLASGEGLTTGRSESPQPMPNIWVFFAACWKAMADVGRAYVCRLLALLVAMVIGGSPQMCKAATAMSIAETAYVRVEHLVPTGEVAPSVQEEIDFAGWAENGPPKPPIWKDGGCIPVYARDREGRHAATKDRGEGCVPNLPKVQLENAHGAPIWKDGSSVAVESAEMHSLYLPTRVPVPTSQLLPTKVSEALPKDLSRRRTQAEENVNGAASMQWVAEFCSEDVLSSPAEPLAQAPLLPFYKALDSISVVDSSHALSVPDYYKDDMAGLLVGFTAGAAVGVRSLLPRSDIEPLAGLGEADGQQGFQHRQNGRSHVSDALMACTTILAGTSPLVPWRTTAACARDQAATASGRMQAGVRAYLKSTRRAVFPPKMYPPGTRGARRQEARAMYLKLDEAQRQEFSFQVSQMRLSSEAASLGFRCEPDLDATDASLPLSTRVAMARRAMHEKEALLEQEEEAAKAVLMAKVGSLVREYHQREAEEPPQHEAEVEWGIEWKKLAETRFEGFDTRGWKVLAAALGLQALPKDLPWRDPWVQGKVVATHSLDVRRVLSPVEEQES